MVADDTAGEAHQNRSQGGQPFPLRDISDGRGDGIKKVVSGNPRTYRAIEACSTWVWLMIRIAEQLGFMKERSLTVCTRAEIGRRARYTKSCSGANFQQSGFEREIS